MTTLLVILHFIAFAIGIGGGIANLVSGRMARTAPPEARGAMMRAPIIIGRITFVAVLILWITGIWLVSATGRSFGEMPPAFWIKIAAAVVLTIAGVMMQLRALTAKRTGVPPDLPTTLRLSMIAGLAALTALIFAIIALH